MCGYKMTVNDTSPRHVRLDICTTAGQSTIIVFDDSEKFLVIDIRTDMDPGKLADNSYKRHATF